MPKDGLKVLKFGGTSVGKDGAMQCVLDIVEASSKQGPVIIVASALSGVTDSLIKMGHLAKQQNNTGHSASYYSVVNRHFSVCKDLAGDKAAPVEMALTCLLEEIQAILSCVKTLKELSPRTLDLLMSYGEKLSCTLLAQLLTLRGSPAEVCDATKIIRTDATFGNSVVDSSKTAELVSAYFAEHSEKIQVVTGFCGSTSDGETTTLGRGGGDFTASIIGGILKASVIEVWTDVNGVLTAHPKIVSEPLSIKRLAYEEAVEMSYFGAKVIYAPTMGPAMRAGVPIHIKNTFNPSAPGTVICKEITRDDDKTRIRAISAIEDVSLVVLKGTSMVGVAGIAGRLFTALTRANVNVILISQASSEHSICLAVAPQDDVTAKGAIEGEFDREIERGQVDKVEVVRGLSVIAVVGSKLRHCSGLVGSVTSVLGEHHIFIVAMAQGSTDLNLSLVVHKDNHHRAIQLIHATFFPGLTPCSTLRPPTKRLHLFVHADEPTPFLDHAAAKRGEVYTSKNVGVKVVGVLSQGSAKFAKQKDDTSGAETGSELSSCGSADGIMVRRGSTAMLDVEDVLTPSAGDSNLDNFVNRVIAHAQGAPWATLFFDDSQDPALPKVYPLLLDHNVAVVTTNRTMWESTGLDCYLLHKLFVWTPASAMSNVVSSGLLSCRSGEDTEQLKIRLRSMDSALDKPVHALSACTCKETGEDCLVRFERAGDGVNADGKFPFELTIETEIASSTIASTAPAPAPGIPSLYRKIVAQALC